MSLFDKAQVPGKEAALGEYFVLDLVHGRRKKDYSIPWKMRVTCQKEPHSVWVVFLKKICRIFCNRHFSTFQMITGIYQCET